MSEKILHRVALLLSMISILVVLGGVRLLYTKMDTIAGLPFGGEDNYQLAQKLFTSKDFADKQKTQLQAAIDQMNGAATTGQPDTQQPTTTTPTQTDNSTAEFPGGKLTPDQLAAIKKNAIIEGDKNAKITIVEYSDPECPFCIRHHNDKTIENTLAAFPGQVNHIFKVVQGVNHPGTEYKSLAILCAAKLKGEDAFTGLYNRILGESTTSSAVSTDKVMEFAKDLKINTSDLQDCITKGDTKSQYEADRAEFKTFTNSPGTPGNIIINNETGEWKLVAGAYPVDTFKQLISAWVK